MGRAPQTFIETKPTTQSCWFGGRYVNVTRLANYCRVDRSYLSRVLSGVRQPSVHYSRTVASALKMDLSAFELAREAAKRDVSFTP